MSHIGKGYFVNFFFVVLLGLGMFCPRLAFGDVCSDGVAFPPFVAKGVDSNLLMIIDNSASMYDLAYVPELAVDQGYCFDESFDDTKTYTGYFNTDTVERYFYNQGSGQFEETTAANAQNECAIATGTKYDNSYLCITINEATNPQVVTAFAAKGNFLNWAAASKFDVEKKVLTGGKFNSATNQLVMESRGCMDKTFVKKVAVNKGGLTYYLTLGIISEAEAGVSNYLTRIEIYGMTATGFQNVDCELAIDEFSDPNGQLGTIKLLTTDCLDPNNTGLMASDVAFNHSMQECWYFNAHGNWQPGAGTLTTIKVDCQMVYNTVIQPSAPNPNEATYLAQYSPSVQDPSDVCYGQYGTAQGYVGRCWEEYYLGGTNCSNKACSPGTDSPTEAFVDPNSDNHSAERFCDSTTSTWIYCNGKYNNNGGCVGNPGQWTAEQECIGGGSLAMVGWTNDAPGNYIESGSFTDKDDCVIQSLRKWCSNIDVPEVVDPTDSMSSGGTTYNVPALMIDTAVRTQMGDPLLTMKGLVAKGATPTGLLHDYQGSIRLGAMAFNDGPSSECTPVEQPVGTGRYVANLYDCLVDKGLSINAASVADTDKRDGGRMISYIGKGTSHTNQLVSAINDMEATTWTPTAEAYYNALGYYTQDSSNRLDIDDYLLNSDYGGTLPSTISPYADPIPLWSGDPVVNPTGYPPSDWTTDPPTVTIVRDASGNLYWTDDGGIPSQFLPDGVTPATEIGDDRDVVWNSFDPVTAHCQKNNILILTDGATTADQNADLVSLATSAAAQDEGIADSPYTCGAQTGSTLLDDLTYYSFNASIYPLPPRFTDESGTPVTGDNIRTYLVSTGTLREVTAGLDPECDSETQLNNAAENGYDTDSVTGNPLGGLYKAEDPSELEYKLRKIFTDIRSGSASGSAASVISSSRSGDGAIYQALFFTSQIDSSLREIDWAGDIHSLWLDRYGNIREDCGGAGPCGTSCCPDQILDFSVDNIISFYSDTSAGSMALARRFGDANGDGEPDMVCSDGAYTTEAACVAAGETWDYLFEEDGVRLQEISYLWSGGEWLADASPNSQRTYDSTSQERYIFTHDGAGNTIPFTTTGLGTSFTADEYTGYLNAASITEADAIVNYIRGLDQVGYRSRLIDWDEDGTPETYKLGDVVHSTPTIVSKPAEDYDIIYKDDSYRLFRKKYENRRTMIYAGGNDGGLHAFNGGYLDRQNNQFLNAPSGKTQYDLGAEVWMFIPFNLLPHLNCLTNTNYDVGSHKYFVDLKPKIFDAKIFDPTDGIHEGGWGTVLVGGMRLGGADTGVDTDPSVAGDEETLRSAYFILDITDPECPPVVLAEFTHADLGFTTSYPTAIPMLKCTIDVDCPTQDFSVSPPVSWPMNWYLAFGSGPHDASDPQTAIEGRSDQKAKLFVLQLGGTDYDGSDGSIFDYVYKNPIGGCPISISRATDGSPGLITGYPREVDPICSDPAYATQATCLAASETWEEFPNSFFGDFITVDFDLSFQADTLYFGSTADTDQPLNDHTGAMHRFVINDVDNPAAWDFSTMLDVGHPVTAAPAAAYDGQNFWLYFGTGRFYTKDDRATTAQQSFYGVKEQDSSGTFDLYEPSGGDLVDVSNASVEDGGTLHGSPLSTTGGGTLSPVTFNDLLNAMSSYDGWKIYFDLTGERNLGQAAVLGDIVTFTTYEPSPDLCTEEGDSYLWAPYYKTGTAYSRSIIGLDPSSPTIVLRKISLGKGLSTTPNIHSGKGNEGTKAFVQTSTGAIIGIEQANPGVTRSGPISWRNLIGE